MSESILIVDDDHALGEELGKALITAGYTTHRTTSVPEARQVWNKTKIDLCLVDIVMPGPSGKVFCREIRERSDAAIIMMSSLSDQDTIIALLDIGADDYIVKPFTFPEMMARARAVLRRRKDHIQPHSASTLQIGDWTFDLQLRRLSNADGLAVPLTQSEATVLRFFAQSPGVVFSREDILAVARTRQHAGKDDRSVDTLIKRLRRKIEVEPSSPKHILTEWGKGYTFQN
ncbi:two-component system, OmpR family, response regulator [Pseudovibrio denitrificans]|uniref:Two-component system, OmpR family, response regulator n=1 Tax=Pseudovibrio denitrificans TaxID=258256 RepID=A0A1I7DS29_9HYPH|nr:response regulator transcription factor [Pseudovibrio denitrificans]SFU14508.1 two-component system, OmpR family, response regulator [Pseudovibrio denitrificans]